MELLLIFLYDFELCKTESDDPLDAIVYFYPTWVNSEQRHYLCSQLMGVTQFFSEVFSVPSIISLQSGKFTVRKMGHYALCVGTDRNIPDMVLKTRSDILYKLLRLFHYDIDALQATLSEEDDCLTDRFSQLLQVYLPILQFATNTFGNIPTLKIPKSATTLYLEACQALQSFQSIEGVLGGTLLYQNKVVATQLNHSLTKQLVVTDPYRIKLPAQNLETPFHLPLGVQLLVIYVEASEVRRLREEVREFHTGLKEIKNWRKENGNSKSGKVTKDGIGMKRDMSRIFTSVPEEPYESDSSEIPELVKDAVKARQLARMEAIRPSNFIITNPPPEKHSQTTDDIVKNIALSVRYYSFGLPSLKPKWCDSPVESKMTNMRPYYNTICDPNYPLFKSNGLPVSYPFRNSRITHHYENLKESESVKKNRARPRSIALKTAEPNDKPPKPTQKAKRLFSLPLKTNTDSNPLIAPQGVPLTPLMAKLSLLAQEEINLETPISSKPKMLKTPSMVKTPAFELASSSLASGQDKNEDKPSEGDDELVQMILYVFGHNNTSVLLLIDNEVATNPEHIHTLWEKSIHNLKKVEERLHKCLDHLPISSSGEYSYAVVDPSWGPIERGGAYQPHQLELLTTLHFTLSQHPNITNILVRGEDTVSYGYQCGQTQVFYQQNCNTISGVPTPADPMGILPTKAKRTLERDHGIVLL
ncbi:uncharacterized protein LOC106674035 isoform X2 [Cimex lectularius]|uniref:CCZ1/INTU/HSP4 first Longin domain-containing protein n=1 Tax=Cimex lectularius TaxID=79782 RepID=A0A8I6TLH7_CIMLE|nr:uncharacterized protein LOC106674035 isoform X2 [Cimex lectularius]